MKILTTSILALIIAGTFTACHKENTARKENCRIVTVNDDGTIYRIWYNNESSVNKITETLTNGAVYTDTFIHAGNIDTIKRTNAAGQFEYKEIITKNSSGLATNVRVELNTAGTTWANDAFEYNGTEIRKQIHTTSGSARDTVTYTWANQNLVSASHTYGALTYVYEYYTDKPRQYGDDFDLGLITGGYQVVRTKNLLKSYSYSSNGGAASKTTITYDFRPDGNISGLVYNNQDGTRDTVAYEYQCN